jgi:hypothetical protein
MLTHNYRGFVLVFTFTHTHTALSHPCIHCHKFLAYELKAVGPGAVPGAGELQRELPGVHHVRLTVPDRLHGHVQPGLQDKGQNSISCSRKRNSLIFMIYGVYGSHFEDAPRSAALYE